MEVGEKYRIPKELCGHQGRIVWISKDGKSIGVECNRPHYENSFTKKPYGMTESLEDGKPILVKIKKENTVYVIDISDKK